MGNPIFLLAGTAQTRHKDLPAPLAARVLAVPQRRLAAPRRHRIAAPCKGYGVRAQVIAKGFCNVPKRPITAPAERVVGEMLA
jgi:hypothetical protein